MDLDLLYIASPMIGSFSSALERALFFAGSFSVERGWNCIDFFSFFVWISCSHLDLTRKHIDVRISYFLSRWYKTLGTLLLTRHLLSILKMVLENWSDAIFSFLNCWMFHSCCRLPAASRTRPGLGSSWLVYFLDAIWNCWPHETCLIQNRSWFADPDGKCGFFSKGGLG